MRADVRKEHEALLALGAIFEGINGNGHRGYSHPNAEGFHWLPSTPSEHRWQENNRTQVAKWLGVSRGDLRRRLGENTRKQPAKVRKARRFRLNGVRTPKTEAFDEIAEIARHQGSSRTVEDFGAWPVWFLRDSIRAESKRLNDVPGDLRNENWDRSAKRVERMQRVLNARTKKEAA